MDTSGDSDISRAPILALEAIRIAEQSARAAERSAAGALATLERAESSLQASERRMTEITAAASSAASEATEARLRATEIASEFRSLEERVAAALKAHGPKQAEAGPPRTAATPPTKADPRPARVSPLATRGAPFREPVQPSTTRPVGSTTLEFEALWDSFDRKADRIVERLKALEARTMTVIRAPGQSRTMDTPPAEDRR